MISYAPRLMRLLRRLRGLKREYASMSKELQFLIYRTPQEDININVVMRDETIWLTQKAMAALFDVQTPAISKHLKNIFAEAELDEAVVISKMETTTEHGAIQGKTQTNKTKFYNLDAVISVGYRVNSAKATQFRIWATKTLKEFIQKGFVMDDERLKQGGQVFGKDYFRELLERVRSIRASERRIWQQITDIFAECSVDYAASAQITKDFYAVVQNKFHFAIAGQTAAEIIYTKADRNADHMGLTTWKNAPNGRILKSDVTTAKNYLTDKEIKRLERAVTGYFDYIEDLIERENTFTMEDFVSSVNEFLVFRKYDILSDKGKISKQQADNKAAGEYNEFNKSQKIVSDFDRAIKAIEKKGGKA
ncbi:virulence RhuM family protein [Iodobacter arcticus]|uniref:Virulence RhuM family protein n=1 Tax=Iodobacter arcticus TaxID=590593 RepID=A0ABW2QYR5_9NEIS